MPRKRMIDPNIWQSEDFSKLSTLAKVVFIGLFSNADDYGYGRAKAAYIKSMVFPYDENMRVADIDKTLDEIASNMSVVFYECNGNEYYSLTNWSKWQRVDRPTDSQIPPLEEDSHIIRRSLDESSTKPRRSIPPNIKEDSIREKKEINNGDLESFFESIWKLYPRKEGKGSVSKTQKQKLYAIGLDEMTRAVNRYKEKIKADNTEPKYIKQGSTFFNSGYVDYLDENYREAEAETDGYHGNDAGSDTGQNTATWGPYKLNLD